jgi:antitoxin (DNA-binding transcriptional repressor) of toxin-antitoxin stability system
MRKVEIQSAKGTLAQLVEAAEAGETIVLARGGEAVAQLVRLRSGRKGIKLGVLKGRLPERPLADIDKPLTHHEVNELSGIAVDNGCGF